MVATVRPRSAGGAHLLTVPFAAFLLRSDCICVANMEEYLYTDEVSQSKITNTPNKQGRMYIANTIMFGSERGQ